MARVHPLDLRIEIAELFDSGVFAGTTPLDAIVAQSSATSLQSVRRAIVALGFTKVKSRAPIKQWIPARFAPPRKLPALTGRHSPVAHAVRELYESGRRTGRCYAADLAPLVDASDERVGKVLKTLRFKVVKRGYNKRVGWESETWAPPRNWPALFLRQRTLRRGGLSANAIARLTDAAAEVEAILRDASTNLLIQGVPIDRRGRMKAEIRAIIQQMYAQDRQTITATQLATVLGMKTTSGPDRLLAEVESLVSHTPKGQAAYNEAEQAAYNEIARLDDTLMRECIKIMSRRSARNDAIGPAAYAIRWVRENHAVA